MLDSILKVLVRDIGSVVKQIELYPDDALVWEAVPGLSNPGGTLALHLAGNLQHFVGTVLGRTGYVRDRDAEFSRRGLPRRDLVQELERARLAVASTLGSLDPARLGEPYPAEVAGVRLETGLFLVHLAAHLAYHLGQLDYHRRAATRSALPAGTMSIPALARAG
jgi:hypothetical protein